ESGRDPSLPGQAVLEAAPDVRVAEAWSSNAVRIPPAAWIMPEPLAQLVGGSQLAEPEVKLESVLPDSARPESVNQDTLSASVGSGPVDAFELDLQHSPD